MSYSRIPTLHPLTVPDGLSMADDIKYALSHGANTFSLPSVEDSSDREISNMGGLYDDSITPPAKAFFVGRQRSLPYPPPDLEGGFSHKHNDTSTPTLIAEKADAHDIDSLPAKKGPRLYRFLRWNYGSVYRRIFCLAVLGNVPGLAIILWYNSWTRSAMSFTTASTATSSNILAALLVRNEHVVNAFFTIFGSWPKKLPLPVRRTFAKVYSYGGIHSGCSIAATLWYIVFLALMMKDFATAEQSMVRCCIYVVSYTVIVLLCLIIAFALPRVRVCMHNWFEGMHRFMGWTAILLFWVQTFLLAVDTASTQNLPFSMVLATTPTLWILVVITLLIAYPWTRLRLRDVEAEVLSDHCVKLNFKYTNVQYGQAVRLSDAPLRETHAFAVIPNPVVPETPSRGHDSGARTPICTDITAREKSTALSTTTLPHASPFPDSERGFSVLVSNAGDWTRKIIRKPPTRIYTRGVPQYGVLRIAGLFSPVLVVATGSGIGPCLSLFVQRPDHPVRIIWSAPCPVETYGQGVVDLIYRADPGAVVIDTKKTGRADLLGLAWRVWQGSRKGAESLDAFGKSATGKGKCEAVVVISNQAVTRKVVYGLESRGLPAYGAIFDS